LTESLRAELVDIGVAALHEAGARRGLVAGMQIMVGPAFAGPAVTVALPAGDNFGIHLALEAVGAGSVLCVASSGQGLYGVLGDLLLAAARVAGVAGIVIDDGIRDIEHLHAPPSVAARCVTARGTVKHRVRQGVGASVALGGVLVEQDDWVVGDRDGVCVLAAAKVLDVVARGHARVRNEDGIRVRLERGEPSRHVLGLHGSPTPSVT
jgi:4-hydroxy-4-methyl-2-oxoglutarate aldolase